MEALGTIRRFLDELSQQAAPSELMLRHCVNEEWFSDTLAWLMDPDASHGAGVTFLEKFIRRVAKRRSSGGYARRATHLKFGKAGRGRGSTTFNLGNAAVLREFFLAKDPGRQGLSGSRYCDLVVADLDSSDGLFLVVENKLFTTNRPGQLREYLRTVEDRYERTDVREYVYLTLDGREPAMHECSTSRVMQRWVPMSWTGDILGILDELEGELGEEGLEIRDLLRWLRHLVHIDGDSAISSGDVRAFRGLLLRAAGECLFEELQRLGEGKTGSWSIETTTQRTVRLAHSSLPAKSLYVEILPSFSLTLQTRHNRRDHFEKIFVPFGADPDQVYNLLDVAARDIYHRHFNNTSLYLGAKRRLRATVTQEKRKYREFFEFLHRRRCEAQLLLTAEDKVWEAASQEEAEVVESVEEGEPELV